MLTYGIENKTGQEVDHHKISSYLESNGYTEDVLMEILNDDNFAISHKCEFNCTIRNIIEQSHIPMFDVLVFIEKNFVDGQKVWNIILDNRNKEALKKEVSESHYIKMTECSLADMF